jgi:hypothetical protein
VSSANVAVVVLLVVSKSAMYSRYNNFRKVMPGSSKNLVLGQDGGLQPRETDRLIDGRNNSGCEAFLSTKILE